MFETKLCVHFVSIFGEDRNPGIGICFGFFYLVMEMEFVGVKKQKIQIVLVLLQTRINSEKSYSKVLLLDFCNNEIFL